MPKLTRLKGPLTLALALSAALILASCGQPDSPAAAPTTAPPETHGNATAGHTSTGAATTSPAGGAPSTSAGRVDITVKGKQVAPRPGVVNIKVGETLTIAVTSDHDNQLHAHGFNNFESEVKAGRRLEFEVTGAKTGLYEVELHHPQLRLLQVAVR